MKQEPWCLPVTLVNAKTGSYDLELIQKLGLSEQLFGTLYQPGTTVGEYQGIPAAVDCAGGVSSSVNSNFLRYIRFGVRPALWIELSD